MERPIHPLQSWLDDKGLDYEQAAGRCGRKGHSVSVDYLKNIARGWNGPSYALAKFLSEKLTKSAVSVTALMDFPYTRKSGAAA